MIYNTGETTEELNAKYNPEGSVLRKAQLRMLDMLLYVDKVCKEQQIPYRLDGGSILGAVRHGGFIPWDDDIDLVFERHDLERLKQYLLKNPHPQYVLQTHETDPGFWGSWYILRDLKSEYIQDNPVHNVRKYKGLQIDFFPYDRGNLKGLQYVSYKLYKLTSFFINRKNYFIANILWHICFKFLYPLFRTFNCFGNQTQSSHSYGTVWVKHFFDINDILPYKTIVFEGFELPGPANPEKILTKIYGDYKKLPTVDKRNKHEAILKIWE